MDRRVNWKVQARLDADSGGERYSAIIVITWLVVSSKGRRRAAGNSINVLF
jgi:hypothetical protein